MKMTCVMVVDDDALFVMTFKIALGREGYKVISALGGVDALKKLETTKPDLILLDIMMPGLDGWETLKKIKDDEAMASIPVIIFTVKDPTSDIFAKKDELGFADYVTKPVRMEELYTRIEKVLQN